jgi:hypothetical protein
MKFYDKPQTSPLCGCLIGKAGLWINPHSCTNLFALLT